MFGEVDLATRPLLSDFDGDARPDALLSTSTGSTLFLQQQDGTLRGESIAIPPAAQLIEVDLDLDGALDVLWTGAEGDTAGALFAASLEQETAAPLEPLSGQTTLTVADLESGYEERLSWELLQLGSEGVQVLRTESPVGKAMRVRFRGKKDNRQGIGAVVELRAGPSYRRHFWRGTTTLYGLGDREYFDVVRVTWPNGVVGNELDVEAGNQILEGGSGLGVQTEGLVGSCPFLYTWNGETFEFISDVLGITPLGLPMAPGLLVPPDHDEYVLVRGDQLVQQDGQYVLQFTEELREVTYLDFVRLDVVDHPAGTEIQPNERFCFPPFPEHRTHVLSQVLEPRRATGSDGKDWTQALAQVDDIHAESFQPLADAQFLGLAEPHWMELEFDPSVLSALPAETELRLICTGWFYWCDASVNMASARTPGVDFTPPLLQIPGADGWVPTGPPVGFPAGKTKTMVLDVSKILSKEDPRIRIFSTLRLYWDSIRLAVGPDQQQRTTSLPPVAARLWSRGFSEPILTDRNDLPERFEWDRLARHPRWNQHPGHYTKYGDVLVLTEAVEDQFVIMGSGDALEIRFDATQLPAVPEGWERDFLVYLDGWAKDRDPNSIQALEVEPLPFHGMGSYPYPSEVSFPDTPAHRKWRQEWNTRAGYEHVIPLSPLREREWIR
jgi:hypothetical protein